MTKRKKRNAVTLVSLLLALSALIGIYIWYGNRPTASDDSENTGDSKVIATLDTSKVTAVHYTGSDVDINLTLENGTWKSKEEPDRPINQDNVKSMLSVINEIRVYDTLEKTEDLADYGLDKPFAYVQATTKDGKKTTLQIGDEVVTGEGYYALVNDDPTVYLILLQYGTGLTLSNKDFTNIEKAPEIEAANITYIGVDNRKGDDVELEYNKTIPVDNGGSTLYNWQILKPYGEGYSADNTKVTEIASNYTTFNYLDCVDYKGDDLRKYGLDKPAATVDIKYFKTSSSASTTPSATNDSAADSSTLNVNKEYKIYIGDKNKDDNYYVRTDGSNMVYTMDSTSVEKMLKVDVFSLINLYVNIPNITKVDKITADVAGKHYDMGIAQSTTQDKDGKDVTKATYSFNGKTVDEGLFKGLYEKMISARYDAELKDEVDVDTLKPVLALSFHMIGDVEKTVTTSFLPYNDSFYIVDKGTSRYFLVDKRIIDDLASAVTSFTGKK